MKTTEFDFDFDAELMPHDPVQLRGRSRESGKMLVLDRSTEETEHTDFSKICDFFQPGDLLVLNDSYMLPNTLVFAHSGVKVPLTIYGYEPNNAAVVGIASQGQLQLESLMILESVDDPSLICEIPIKLLTPTLEKAGWRTGKTVPFKTGYRKAARNEYSSVYASTPGSLEIPSAALHFSKDILRQAVEKGLEIAYITLHVGATEVLAVRHISEEEIEKHEVRSEGRRVVAVGTTVMRTLETLATDKPRPDKLLAQKGWSDLYIYPGFEFRAVDVLLTNLHRPRSSHIVLTAAFAGTKFVMRSYAEIAERGDYEFGMFGDSMLIV
ncbi:S-adenosylmethionine:tRNA ribosyltransferase-isomerase [Nemania sp. FL0916]|nr:S-adenosylmethionine:tRNA ribosyltransferase-isomerase [Nemania sp. FL0916]